MPSIEFGRRGAATQFRDRASEYLAASDDRRTKTVELTEDAPERIVERGEEQAYTSIDPGGQSEGMSELSESERESLKKQHSTFSWQTYGFEAMRVKRALQSRGVTDWMNYYEPGEGVSASLSRLRSSKSKAARGGGQTAIEGMRHDMEEEGNTRRRQTQARRVRGAQVKSAKRPAVVEQDPGAVEFVREEQMFGGDVFDLTFRENQRGFVEAGGRDVELVEERNQQRSERARDLDNQKVAPITRDPMKWAANPDEYDFPGVDTLEPEKKHAARSERAREVDENELAPIADSPEAWAADMDETDLPGVDTPPAMGLGPNEPDPDPPELDDMGTRPDPSEFTGGTGVFTGTGLAPEDFDTDRDDPDVMGERPSASRLSADAFEGLASGPEADMAFDRSERERAAVEPGPNPGGSVSETGPQNDLMADTRAKQDTLGFAADPTEARESRVAEEENEGGLLADMRESVGRGPSIEGLEPGEQGTIPGVEPGETGFEVFEED